MISGFYLRVKRGDRIETLDITEMTKEEIVTAMDSKNRAMLISWITALARFIKDIRTLEQQLEHNSN